jgi:hypothetical protein
MVIVGRIFDIKIINDKYAQVVLKKKMSDKIVPVAIGVFGYWKDKIIKEMKLKPKDKIKGNIYLKSNLWTDKNGVQKYLTDIYFKEVYLIEEGPRPMGLLFHKEEDYDDDEVVSDSDGNATFRKDIKFDPATGEIFE